MQTMAQPLSFGLWATRFNRRAGARPCFIKTGVPNTALPVDIDGDGDMDVIGAKRVRQQIVIIENQGIGDQHELRTAAKPIRIVPGFDAPTGWRGLSNAFHADSADINNDGRLDLLVNVLELADDPSFRHAGLGWLEQGESLDDPWVFHRDRQHVAGLGHRHSRHGYRW